MGNPKKRVKAAPKSEQKPCAQGFYGRCFLRGWLRAALKRRAKTIDGLPYPVIQSNLRISRKLRGGILLEKYQTEQRKRLLAFFAAHPDEQFAIDALERSIKGVSRSAIYRNVNQMAEEGVLRRFPQEGSRKFLYQYIGSRACAEHFHLKCSACGSILHMDSEASKMLAEVINQHVDFELDQSKTLLFGCCAACK